MVFAAMPALAMLIKIIRKRYPDDTIMSSGTARAPC